MTSGRHRDMVGEVECEFRPVDPKWVEHLMGWANWYAESSASGVAGGLSGSREPLPGGAGFDTAFLQPLMQPGAPMTTVEPDFWASADPESCLFKWKFDDGPHTGVFISEEVFDGSEPVTYVRMTSKTAPGSSMVIR